VKNKYRYTFIVIIIILIEVLNELNYWLKSIIFLFLIISNVTMGKRNTGEK